MNRILIIGCPGSGKSTLARVLGRKLQLPVVHLDRLWWRKGWQSVSLEEFDRQLERVLEQDQWILDGNYSRTMEQRLERCDTIIYLDFDRWHCLGGLCQRRLGGRVRPDKTPGCPEHLNRDMLRWVWNYNQENRARNYLWMAKASHARSIVLHNRKEVHAFLDQLSE